MGRPPLGGGPAFRFTQSEVLEMESCLNEVNYSIPSREVMCSLAEKFSASAERSGRIVVQPKQVWNWFQNRRYAQRAKVVKPPVKLTVSPMARDESHTVRTVAPSPAPADNAQVEFEAKSARDGAWYDVAAFLSHRMFETSDPEVRVRFAGFGVEEDEWINVRNCVRQRSLPCEAGECVVVLPGDLILCFLEGTEQALYFDAHVLDAQRRRHDVRGCRCRFLVRYDHNQSEEIVPLRKICRRPETDHRLQMLTASEAPSKEDGLPKDSNVTPSPQKSLKQFKLMNVNTNEVTTAPIVTIAVAAAAPPPPAAAVAAAEAAVTTDAAVTTMENDQQSASDIIMADAVVTTETSDKLTTADIS